MKTLPVLAAATALAAGQKGFTALNKVPGPVADVRCNFDEACRPSDYLSVKLAGTVGSDAHSAACTAACEANRACLAAHAKARGGTNCDLYIGKTLLTPGKPASQLVIREGTRGTDGPFFFHTTRCNKLCTSSRTFFGFKTDNANGEIYAVGCHAKALGDGESCTANSNPALSLDGKGMSGCAAGLQCTAAFANECAETDAKVSGDYVQMLGRAAKPRGGKATVVAVKGASTDKCALECTKNKICLAFQATPVNKPTGCLLFTDVTGLTASYSSGVDRKGAQPVMLHRARAIVRCTNGMPFVFDLGAQIGPDFTVNGMALPRCLDWDAPLEPGCMNLAQKERSVAGAAAYVTVSVTATTRGCTKVVDA